MPEFRQNRMTKQCAGERARRPAAMLVALALLAGCDERNQPSREPPAREPPDQRAKLLTIPDEYKNRRNPLPATEANRNEGGARYEEYCAACHGLEGKANTLLGGNLYPPASDLTSPHVEQHTDGRLYWIISEGIRYSGMPGGRKLHTEQQIWQIVLYVRQLQGKVATKPAQGPTGEASSPLPDHVTRRLALQ